MGMGAWVSRQGSPSALPRAYRDSDPILIRVLQNAMVLFDGGPEFAGNRREIDHIDPKRKLRIRKGFLQFPKGFFWQRTVAHQGEIQIGKSLRPSHNPAPEHPNGYVRHIPFEDIPNFG